MQQHICISLQIHEYSFIHIQLVGMQIGIVVSTLIKPITVILLHHFLSPLLKPKNQEQDDKSQQCREGDTNRSQGCSPPRGVVNTTAVNHSGVEWHHRTAVSTDLYLWGIARPA